MAADASLRRCRACYARLLRLYPQAFRERFGEGMTQTFADLCRQEQQAGRPVATVLLWTCAETFVSIIKEHAAQVRRGSLTQESTIGLKTVRFAAIVVGALMAAGIATVMFLARGTGEDITGVVAPALLITIISGVVAVVATVVQKRASGKVPH
jgi:hypothetical protein